MRIGTSLISPGLPKAWTGQKCSQSLINQTQKISILQVVASWRIYLRLELQIIQVTISHTSYNNNFYSEINILKHYSFDHAPSFHVFKYCFQVPSYLQMPDKWKWHYISQHWTMYQDTFCFLVVFSSQFLII